MKQLILIVLIGLILLVIGCTAENQDTNSNDIKFQPKTDVNYAELSMNPKDVNFAYVLRGEHWKLTSQFYGGLNDYLQSQPRSITLLKGEEITDVNFVEKFIDELNQKIYLKSLVDYIKQIEVSDADKVRIVVSLVQNIPYDYNAYYRIENDENNIEKYPYQVLYLNTGVCGEKSRLLIYFLRELGYGTAYINFEKENHAVTGIKCPIKYSYKDSGYCFIESTAPTIITYSEGEYLNAGKLSSTPKIIVSSEGMSFDSVSEEFNDALRYKELIKDHLGNNYSDWLSLMSKYGLEKSSCFDGSVLCNGECWTACLPQQIFNCDAKTGATCKWDAKNCPTGMTACNNECYPNCTEGTFECAQQGVVCHIVKYR
ncbi:MAG: hypothetical protein ABH986_05405 [archaeon]